MDQASDPQRRQDPPESRARGRAAASAPAPARSAASTRVEAAAARDAHAKRPSAALASALELAAAGHDPEGVHQVRAQALRLSVALELCGLRALRPDLAWLRRELRRARDLDVALARELPLALQARLSSERAREQARVREAVLSPRCQGLVLGVDAALSRLALEPRRLRRHAERVRTRARAALARPLDFDALHALRRAVRRMRYALHALGLPSDAWSELQHVLGAACDAHAFLDLADRLALDRVEHARVTEPIEREERLRAQHALEHVRAQLARLRRSAAR